MRLRRSAVVLSTVALAGMSMGALPAAASSPPDSGTLTPASSPGVVTSGWTGMISGANPNSDCSQSVSGAVNDHHTFTLAVPAGFYATHSVKMEISETAPAADSILTVNLGKTSLGSSDNSSVGGSESKTILNPAPGTYDAITCAFSGVSPYSASVTLTTAPPATTTVTGGTSTTAGPSSYGNYPLAAIPGSESSGEPSIGVDWGTGNVYFQANLNTIKAQFPSYGAAPVLTDVSCLATTATTLDPIMYTDSQTGRVGVSQLAANPVLLNSITNFFDSTPNPTGPQTTTCRPSQGGGAVAGPDHQTLGGGVYPKVLPVGAGPMTPYQHTFYYCSQTILAGALCSRSDNGGTSFTNGTPPYTTQCGGLHGHVRVGPEGNVYLPNKSCGSGQGLAVSTDAGQTWSLKPVTGTTVSDGSDPSVAADRAGTVYFASISSGGKPQVSVSGDKGTTWKTPINIGENVKIAKSVFPEVIAGDAGRATVAFVGSTTDGDRNLDPYGKSADGSTYTGGTFDMYTSTTVDGGATWNTQDITPNDPVQRGQICTNGTTCSAGRNLLDFNDITVDKTGHAVISYSDGCTAACVTSTKVSDNKQTSAGVIGRQISGPLLFVPPAAAGRFHPITPARILDTRTTNTPVQAGSDQQAVVTGVGGVPASGVSAVVLNATVPNPAAMGYLEVYPIGGKPANRTSDVNWLAGRTTANAVTVKVGTGGKVGLLVDVGRANVVLDVVGWYGDATDHTGDYYHPSEPSRILDTRTSGSGGPVAAGADRTLAVAGHGGVPANGASGVVLTLTAVNATKPTYVEVYPTGSKPVNPTSDMNVVPNRAVAALVTVPIGTGGSVQLHVDQGSVDLVADVLGYYTSSGSRYVSLDPHRLLDTRLTGTPVQAGSDRTVTAAGVNNVPANAAGVIVNTTGVNATEAVNVSMYPAGAKPSPRTSVLNLTSREEVADLVVIPVGTGGAIDLSVSRGQSDLVLDVAGYFTPLGG